MRAAPQISRLRGLCLEAPVLDLVATAHRMLGRSRDPDAADSGGARGGAGMPGFLVSLTLVALELWSGFDMEELRPIDALAELPAELPSLIIGAGLDTKVPTETVRRGYETLRAPAGRKELWIDPGSRHGRVFEDRPTEYRRRLAALLERVIDAAKPR